MAVAREQALEALERGQLEARRAEARELRAAFESEDRGAEERERDRLALEE